MLPDNAADLTWFVKHALFLAAIQPKGELSLPIDG
jgi:hypothetical protein